MARYSQTSKAAPPVIVQDQLREAWLIEFDFPQSYRRIVKLMERLVAARAAEKIPDTILLLEHEPVITLGLRTRPEHIPRGTEEIRRRGIAVEHSTRGGGPTYHGPGQIVLYPIFKLAGCNLGPSGMLGVLEETALRTIRKYGVGGFRREGMPGVWTAQGKVAAIGYRIRQAVTFHGLSLNIDCELWPFELIIPCGLRGERVSSLQEVLGDRCPPVREVRCVLARQLAELLHYRLRQVPIPVVLAAAPG